MAFAKAVICTCDNCMKLECLLQNVTSLRSLLEQFQLAFTEDLPTYLQKEIHSFLNSDWQEWQQNLPQSPDESLMGDEDQMIFADTDEIDDDEKQHEAPQIVIKSAASLFEPDDEEDEEELGPVVTSVKTLTSLPSTSNNLRKQNFVKFPPSSPKGKKWMQCPVCELSFSSYEQLNEHTSSHEVTHECTQCRMSFYNEQQASEHRCEIAEELKQLESTETEEIVLDDDDDEEVNEEEALLKCQHCDTYFLSKDELEEHEEKAHLTGAIKDYYSGLVYKVPEEGVYCCGLCGKSCNNIFSFNTHMRTRHKANPLKPPEHKCETCEKCYDTLTRLKRHVAYQHGNRNQDGELIKSGHNCDVCGKGFPSSYRLKHHYRTHTGEKPCECEFCGKCFRNTSHLNDHRRIHTGERPYKCLHCGNSYIQGSQLKAHLRSRHGMSIRPESDLISLS